jgi:hypothetical protein
MLKVAPEIVTPLPVAFFPSPIVMPPATLRIAEGRSSLTVGVSVPLMVTVLFAALP